MNTILHNILFGVHMSGNWVDAELRNWSRWANAGPTPHPRLPGSFLGSWVIPDGAWADEEKPIPIHEENAKRVQAVFDSAITIERKVLQAEYLSPWQYARFSGGVSAAVRRINELDPSIKISVTGYETVLASIKRRVERIFS
ncbi:hypothetical protein [Paraburkholderia tropica]|uniref:hypothetical protein n=1 Tax=Paraburkholderia tropica TaxID=92647 RepID=UPI002AB67458|nr:hypothetical protein [Paraburkholderia tropica]